jgi:hypothetical protein
MTPQLKLFSDGDAKLPVPLEGAERYSFPLQYHTQGDDTLAYAVQDWIAGLTGDTDPKSVSRAWAQFKKQSYISEVTLKLPYKARDGKTYQRDFVPDVVLYKFAAYTRALKERPQIAEIKDFLAKAGAFVDELRQDPETIEVKIAAHRQAKTLQADKDPAWQMAREMGVVTRKQFTAALVTLNPHVNIGRATNEVYKGTLGATAEGLRKVLQIGKKQNPREHMSTLALGYTMIAEESARIQLADYADDDIVPVEMIHAVIVTVSEAIGLQASQWAQTLGVNLITGRKALKP